MNIIKHLYKKYGYIDEIDLYKNNTKVKKTYNPGIVLAALIEQLEVGKYFPQE